MKRGRGRTSAGTARAAAVAATTGVLILLALGRCGALCAPTPPRAAALAARQGHLLRRDPARRPRRRCRRRAALVDELTAALGSLENDLSAATDSQRIFKDATSGLETVSFPEATRIPLLDQMVVEEVLTLEDLWQLWGSIGPMSMDAFENFWNEAQERHKLKLTTKAMKVFSKRNAAKAEVRTPLQLGRLFMEHWDDQGLLSFEGALQASEIAELLREGEIAKEELEPMWAALPKRDGDRVDISAFRVLMDQIDALFEFEEEQDVAPEANEDADDELAIHRVSPMVIHPGARQAVLDAIKDDAIEFEQEGEFVQPKQFFSELGLRSPLADFGECGKCNLSRLRNANVRPDFLEECVREIKQRYQSSTEGLNYLSYGGGYLYFDWALLDRLINKEGINIKTVWVVEWADCPGHVFQQRYRRALSALSGWFNGELEILSFGSDHDVCTFNKFIEAKPREERAHILMRVDAAGVEQSKIDEFREMVCRDDTLDLELTTGRNPEARFFLRDRRPRGKYWKRYVNRIFEQRKRKWTDVEESFFDVLDRVQPTRQSTS